MIRQPKIYSIPLANTGTHETIVIVVDGVPQSVNTWNYTEDEKGGRSFMLDGVTSWRLHIAAGSMVQVIR